MSRTVGIFVFALAVAGSVLRAILAVHVYPQLGDHSYSYCYRAMLISHGDFRGVYYMWHPPGMPVLVALGTWLSAFELSPYAVGVVLNIASAAALVLIVDRLIAPRARWPATRVVVATFIAFYEGLFSSAAAPYADPPYTLLLYAVVAILDRSALRAWQVIVAGLLAGYAFAIRREGMAPIVGLSSVLMSGALTERSRSALERGQRVALFVVCAAVSSAWSVIGMGGSYGAYSAYFTIPPATGVKGNLFRLVECFYYACVSWLPQVLLLPYWLLVGAGLFGGRPGSHRYRLHLLLLAIVLPTLVAVSLSIMKKTTGASILPAAAIWIGLGCEHLILRTRLNHVRGGVILAVVLISTLTAIQAARFWFREGRAPSVTDPVPCVAADLLRGEPPGRVWAFGWEPETYLFRNTPIFYPCTNADSIVNYNKSYDDHVGDPAGFVGALREAGFEYLVIVSEESGESLLRGYGGPLGRWHGGPVRLSDVMAIANHPEAYGLMLVGSAPANLGKYTVTVLRLRSSSSL